MPDLLRLRLALIVAGAVLGRTAHADLSSVVLNLDAPDQQAPEYLCVVSENASCPGNPPKADDPRCDTRQLQALKRWEVLADGDPYNVGFQPGLIPRTQQLARPDLLSALGHLTTGRQNCDGGKDVCAPKVNLAHYYTPTGYTGNIVCGTNYNKSGRVVFVGIDFTSMPDGGISQVILSNSSATLVSRDPELFKKAFTAKVLGGDYMDQNQDLASKDLDRSPLELVPRCFAVNVSLPPHPDLTINKVTFARGAGPPTPTCAPDIGDDSTISIRMPVAPLPGKTTLNIELSDESSLEASWSARVPPVQVSASLRSFRFRWRRDCLAGEWMSTPDDHDAVACEKDAKAPNQPPRTCEPRAPGADWDARCPQATVAESDRICTLEKPRESVDVCDYVCTARPGDRLFSLPVEVKLDRYRAAPEPGGAATVVYGWTDTVHVVGEQLTSFVPPADRRLVVNFLKQSDWKNNYGDTFEQVRVVLPGGQVDNIDLPPDKLAPRWAAVSAPNLTCHDTVRFATFGGKAYREVPRPANRGQVDLVEPFADQPHWHAWLIAGGGVLAPLDAPQPNIGKPREFNSYALVGVGGEYYIDRHAISLELDATFEVGKTPYGQVSRGGTIVLHDLAYEHVVARGTVEFWPYERLHAGVSVGGAGGIPLFNDDQPVLGSLKFSANLEVNLRLRLQHSGSTWLELAGGARLGEQHEYFTTDFTGTPLAIGRRLFQPYVVFRLRIRFG